MNGCFASNDRSARLSARRSVPERGSIPGSLVADSRPRSARGSAACGGRIRPGGREGIRASSRLAQWAGQWAGDFSWRSSGS